jgi:rhamnogalacturonan II specific xylosyltransferase
MPFSLHYQVKPLDHSHDLPPPGKKGRTYICSCMIFMRPTDGAKLVMKKWIEELKAQPWSKTKKANDQPAFNWALNKTAGQVFADLLAHPHSTNWIIGNFFLCFWYKQF